jgi:DNA-binding NarL/FixJ family response regulator
MEKIRVVAVDDHPLIRHALAKQLEEQEDMTLLAEGCSGDDVLTLLEQYRPDVLLLDLDMPKSKKGEKKQRFQAFPVIGKTRDQYPATAIILLTQHLNPILVQGAIERGVSGYLLKDDDLSLNVPEAIRAVHKGAMYLSQSARRHAFNSRTKQPEPAVTLRPRQVQVLRTIYLEPNASYADLALHLEISESTFKSHLSNAFAALGVNSATAALLRCIELGIIDHDHHQP